MHQHYGDIIDRIGVPPVWFDENAVPRFDAFKPDDLANIYAGEAALVRIACQGCPATFDVAISSVSDLSRIPIICAHSIGPAPLLRHYILGDRLHYGDPPNMLCCAAGPTMGANSIRVLEYWYKPFAIGKGLVWNQSLAGYHVANPKTSMSWARDATLEIALGV